MINLNASRICNAEKLKCLSDFIETYSPSIVCIQEVNIRASLREFSRNYQAYVNIEKESKDGVGIVTLIRKGIKVLDVIVGINGRIIGIKCNNIQVWNIYPKSGTAYKGDREKFFREDLTELMIQWKDSSRYIFQVGDHNCIHRVEDSLHNANQHLQQGLINHMKIHGLSDDFIKVHGKDIVAYSRITEISSTRIDYILSNTNECVYF